LPITYVNAYQAAAFCRWLGRRLPTSDEWERSAVGADPRLYPWGDAPPDPSRVHVAIDSYGNFPDGAVRVDDPAYAEGATPDGLMHMLGNTREWTATPADCEDCAVWDGVGRVASGALVIRDIGWATTQINIADPANPLLQTFPADPALNDIDLGFRCASS
jgi:formylglycine-generating enzyme required for sulfatase activity